MDPILNERSYFAIVTLCLHLRTVLVLTMCIVKDRHPGLFLEIENTESLCFTLPEIVE